MSRKRKITEAEKKQAYLDGRAAFETGVRRQDAPIEIQRDEDLDGAWLDGWLDAEEGIEATEPPRHPWDDSKTKQLKTKLLK